MAKTIDEWLNSGAEFVTFLSRRQFLVAGVVGLLLLLLALVALIPPGVLGLVESTTDKPGPMWSSRGFYVLGTLAATILLLLMLFLVAARRRNMPAASPANSPSPSLANTFVIYSPHIFAEELRLFLTEPNRNQWGQRALYVGTDGADHWLAVCGHDDYKFKPKALIDCMKQLLHGVAPQIQTVVSLGPGDGQVDTQVLTSITQAGGRPSYIPVDISEGLLLLTMKALHSRHGDKVAMPFGILGDFEYGWSKVAKLLSEKAGPGTLWAMLGNTAANLDEGLEELFQKIWIDMKPGDFLMFDVMLGNFDKRLDSSEDGSYDPNLLFRGEEMQRRYMRFIAEGARRITHDEKVFNTKDKRLSDVLLRVIREKNPANGYDQLHLVYKGGNQQQTIFRWRRYAPTSDQLKAWLQTCLPGCAVVNATVLLDGGENTEFILLRKSVSSTANNRRAADRMAAAGGEGH